MGLYRCNHCSYERKGERFLKHITSGPLHSTIFHKGRQEIVSCEKCDEDKSTELVLFVNEKWEFELKCKKCAPLAKRKIDFKYYLSNKLLENLDDYYRWKSIKCLKCDQDHPSDNNMWIDNEDATSTYCSSCLLELAADGDEFPIHSFTSRSKDPKQFYQAFTQNERSIQAQLKYSTWRFKQESLKDKREELVINSSLKHLKPKASYGSLEEYFREMSYHLYLEQRVRLDPIKLISSEYVGKNLLSVKLYLSKQMRLNMIPPKLQKIEDVSAFTKKMAIFLFSTCNEDEIWSCSVASYRKLNVLVEDGDMFDVTLRIHNWNASNPSSNKERLWILPGSPIISRVFDAMSRGDFRFSHLVLGNEKTKQCPVFPTKSYFTKLNVSQKKAVDIALSHSVSAIRGPPGTGKTTAIVEIILQAVKTHKKSPVIVVAASNVAIDNIADKFKEEKSINCSRIVSEMRESDYISDNHPLHDMCLHNEVASMLSEPLRKTFYKFQAGKSIDKEPYHRMRSTFYSYAHKILESKDVILTTTVSAGSYALRRIPTCSTVIMDESTQSNEAVSMIVMQIQGLKNLVLVGDEKQLSSFSQISYLQHSLFQRVLTNESYGGIGLVDVQYRMHPAIAKFPVDTFYDGRLKDGVTNSDRSQYDVPPILFIDHGNSDEYKEDKSSFDSRAGFASFSAKNEAEAYLVVELLTKLVVGKQIDKRKICVITPYSSHRNLIAQEIKMNRELNPSGKSINDNSDEDFVFANSNSVAVKSIDGLVVSSIDAFQGHERDIVIFSCVRSNKRQDLGFLADERRMNVALTRARHSLIIVGDKKTLAGTHLWGKLLEAYKKRSAIVDWKKAGRSFEFHR